MQNQKRKPTKYTNGFATRPLVNTYTYDSFGRLMNSTGSVTNRFQYTAREFDTETGLYFYRARYLDSQSGRFISEDPIRFEGGPDFYVYVRNHSTDLIDPLGLLQVCCRSAHLHLEKYAEKTLQPPPCHCFLRLSDGHTLGAYFSWNIGTFGALVLRRDDPTDSSKYKKEEKCSDVPGKPCENDAKVKKAFDATPKNLGTYGFGLSDAGTSNDPLFGLMHDAGLGLALPTCAWGRSTGDNSTYLSRWLKLNFPLMMQ